jgi:dihydroneopterin triphosphate diphosphatase
MLPYKNPVSVLVVIYTANLDILLLERADHAEAWQSVTGSQETGESLRQTAERELFEETGLRPSDGVLSDWQQQNVYEIYAKWQHRYAPGTSHNSEHVFGLRLPGILPVQLSPREHVSHVWLPAAAAADKVFSPSNRAAIHTLIKQ